MITAILRHLSVTSSLTLTFQCSQSSFHLGWISFSKLIYLDVQSRISWKIGACHAWIHFYWKGRSTQQTSWVSLLGSLNTPLSLFSYGPGTLLGGLISLLSCISPLTTTLKALKPHHSFSSTLLIIITHNKTCFHTVCLLPLARPDESFAYLLFSAHCPNQAFRKHLISVC